MKTIVTETNPEVLKWLKENFDWRIDEVSKRRGMASEIISEFESGKKSPKLSQLTILSESESKNQKFRVSI